MDASYEKLVHSLQELVSLYGNLFDLLVKERQVLISSDLEKIQETNKTKEALLYKIRAIDKIRAGSAVELAKIVGLSQQEPPRLLQISEKLGPTRKSESEMLFQLHKTLTLQIARVTELNQENENYTRTALKILDGAIEDIKGAAVGQKKKTYGKQGQKTEATDRSSGNFVSKEA